MMKNSWDIWNRKLVLRKVCDPLREGKLMVHEVKRMTLKKKWKTRKSTFTLEEEDLRKRWRQGGPEQIAWRKENQEEEEWSPNKYLETISILKTIRNQ